jgi:signal transduction histidine kinase
VSKTNRLDLLQIFRYFTGMAMVYFAAMVVFTAIQTGEGDSLTQVQAYVNFGTNLILLIYLSIPWLWRKLRGLYLPTALVYSTVVPIFSNLIYLADPYENIWNTITRSWVLLPILMVPIVLIAWQYKFRYVVLIVVFSTYVELFVLIPHFNMVNVDALLILGGPLIRAFSFGTIGLIVNRLVAVQQTQRKELILANIRLSEHSQTLEQLATSRERNRLSRELHDSMIYMKC